MTNEPPSSVPSSDEAPTAYEQQPVQYQPPAPPPSSGALPYGLGFLSYIPIPFASLVIAGIVMAAVYPSMKRKGGLAAENARHAANWGLSLIMYMVLDALLFAIFLFTSSGKTGFFPAGITVVFYLALAVAHLVVIIMGLVAANRRRVFHNRLAIPFIR